MKIKQQTRLDSAKHFLAKPETLRGQLAASVLTSVPRTTKKCWSETAADIFDMKTARFVLTFRAYSEAIQKVRSKQIFDAKFGELSQDEFSIKSVRQS